MDKEMQQVRVLTWFELAVSTVVGFALFAAKMAMATAVVILTARFMGAL